jgi:Heavy metal binding domain
MAHCRGILPSFLRLSGNHIMYARAIIFMATAAAVAACSGSPAMDGTRTENPANPQAAESPVPQRSPILDPAIAAELRSSGSVAAPASTGGAAYYTCIMHPQIHEDHAGVCPICGMPLIQKMPDGGASKGGAQ